MVDEANGFHEQHDHHIQEVMTPVPDSMALLYGLVGQVRDINAKLTQVQTDLAVLKEERTKRIGAQEFTKWIVDYGSKILLALLVIGGFMLAQKHKP